MQTLTQNVCRVTSSTHRQGHTVCHNILDWFMCMLARHHYVHCMLVNYNVTLAHKIDVGGLVLAGRRSDIAEVILQRLAVKCL